MAIESDPLNRVVTGRAAGVQEEQFERSLRPRALEEYVGQEKIRDQLGIFIAAAKKRGEALDHVLLFGPPGLGKTTLSHIIAHELGVNLRQTSGPVLERPGDLAALLTNLEPRDVLFIDEIHRLSPVVEEILYPALEDFQIDIMIGEGPAARSVKLDLPPFTLVGATTRAGMLTNPLRDRFGIVARLEFYNADELTRIVTRSAALLGIAIDPAGAHEIARRSRGTPRIANRLLRRVRDFAEVQGRRRHHAARSPTPRWRCSTSTSWGSTSWTASCLQTVLVEVRRRPGRRRQPRRGDRRGARHDRGRARAVPDPAGLPAAHLARPHRHRAVVPPFRPRAAAAVGRALRAGMTRAPFTHPVRVYYEDTDAAGVVYYANYLKFMERARTEWLAARGPSLAELERDHAIVFVVTRAEVEFRAPARLGDLLAVGVDVVPQGRARCVARQDIRRGDEVVVAATITLACVDRTTFKPRRMPANLLEPHT